MRRTKGVIRWVRGWILYGTSTGRIPAPRRKRYAGNWRELAGRLEAVGDPKAAAELREMADRLECQRWWRQR